MIVRVIGSAAGGGVPQWNCSCANCAAARSGAQPRRLQSCVAIGNGDAWILLNCSPDIAAQIEAFAPLQPRERRGTPIAGMLFTDANIDHIGGLAVLRQTGRHRFTLRSSAVVREIATAQTAFAPFASPPHRWLDLVLDDVCTAEDDADFAACAFEIRAFPVPGLTPGYAGRRDERGAAIAYEIRERGGGKALLFAPVFAGIDDVLRDAVMHADVAMLDGSFYSDDELMREELMEKSARHLGHQPIGGSEGTLEQIRGMRGHAIFVHVNNSNPVLNPASDAAAAVREAGHAVAYDGMAFRM